MWQTDRHEKKMRGGKNICEWASEGMTKWKYNSIREPRDIILFIIIVIMRGDLGIKIKGTNMFSVLFQHVPTGLTLNNFKSGKNSKSP